MTDGITRRNALAGAAVLGAGVPLLAACGSEADTTPQVSAGEIVGPAEDVPVGGGRIYDEQKLVVTQPVEGEFHGFSSICPHQGCPVTRVGAETIDCTCHGSKFSVTDGSVQIGPASSGLTPVDLTVTDGEIVVG